MRIAASNSSDSHEISDVSAVVPTWNSASRLEKSLEAVEKNLRPRRIIVVDRDSEDSTPDIARRHGATVLKDTVSLGSARMKGVRESDTEWVAFIDDDISLPEGFIEEALGKAGEGVGAVQGAVRSIHEPYREMLTESYERRFEGRDSFDLRPGERGLTSATLVRKVLVEDLDLNDMDTWEDWIITQRIIDLGFRWVVVRPFVDHFHPHEDLARKAGWNAAGVLNLARTGRMPMGQALRWYLDILIEAPRDAFRMSVQYGDWRHFIFHMHQLAHILFAPRHLIGAVPRRPKATSS
ncbi:MAG: glycosyltransferase family 2 protein [Euryarchaeota archaeon]|nr:glycosyltransferase family 2 protein [Euryarchaeota archaeon]